MPADRIRAFGALEYGDSYDCLVKVRELEPQIANSSLSLRERTLRTHELKEWRELREAALFCQFIGERVGTKVRLARGESQDYDIVARRDEGGVTTFTPVQIEEIVPAHPNPNAALSEVIGSLSKYVDSADLVVAIHLNKQVTFMPDKLVIPRLPIASLWVFGSVTPDASRWALWGDLLSESLITEHEYPAA